MTTPQNVTTGGEPLGNTYKLTVPLEQAATKNGVKKDGVANEARRKRFALLASAARIWPESAIKKCFRFVAPGTSYIDILYSPIEDRARITNLIRCNTGACPVCGPYNRLQKGLAWSSILSDKPNKLALLTLTVEHHAGERFTAVLARLLEANKRMWSGRWWNGFKAEFFIEGRLTSLEVTDGENGFHPHLHIILVSDARWPDSDVAIAWAIIAKRWQSMVAKAGGFASIENGADFRAADAGSIDYLTKDAGESLGGWGLVEEATLGDYKKGRRGGRSTLQLLGDYTFKQDRNAGSRWYEIERGLKGRSRLRSSNGLWEALGGPEHIQAQENEFLDITESDVLLLSISQTDWLQIWDKRIVAQVYEIAAKNDAQALMNFLLANGITFSLPPYPKY